MKTIMEYGIVIMGVSHILILMEIVIRSSKCGACEKRIIIMAVAMKGADIADINSAVGIPAIVPNPCRISIVGRKADATAIKSRRVKASNTLSTAIDVSAAVLLILSLSPI